MEIKEGSEFRKEFQTLLEHSAKNVGSGNLEVLSTPSLISFIENTAREPLDEYVGNEKVSVGTRVDIKHIRPSKIGENVTINVRILLIDGTRFIFWAEAYSEGRKIAYGIHERAVVDRKKFLSSLEK